MNPSLMMAAIVSLFPMSGMVRTPSAKSERGKLPTAKENQRNADRSQRVMRTERGMRPREAVGARRIERRAKHAVKGSPL